MTWAAIKLFLKGAPIWVWLLLFWVCSIGISYGMGYADGVEHQAAKAQKAIARQTVKQDKVTVKVVTKYVDRVKTIREKGDTIIKKVTEYVTPENDAACVIPDSFVELWNHANKGTVPEASARVNAETSGSSGASEGR